MSGPTHINQALVQDAFTTVAAEVLDAHDCENADAIAAHLADALVDRLSIVASRDTSTPRVHFRGAFVLRSQSRLSI